MSWWALRARPAAAERDAVAAWLVSRSGQAVEEQDDGTLVAFQERADAAAALADQTTQRFGLGVELEELPATDWGARWRDGIQPRRIGRLLLTPSWLAATIPDSGPRVVLDPENAFGSGEHGSTRGALALLERHLKRGDRVLDLGSGSGILSIAAVRLGAGAAIGIECDAEAVAVAERNAAANGVTDRTVFLTGDAHDLIPVAGPAEMIVSNILRTVNVTLLPVIQPMLTAGGLAIFAGMEENEESLFRPALAAAGFVVEDEVRDAGWWSVAVRRA